MTRANEIALEAAAAKAQAVKVEVNEEEAREHERQVRAWDAAYALIERSPLSEWFPGVTFEPYMTKELTTYYFGHCDVVVAPEDRPGGTNPELTTMTLGLVDTEAGVVVEFVSSKPNAEYPGGPAYGDYWEGPVVESAADIGEHLRKRILRAGEGWLGNTTADGERIYHVRNKHGRQFRATADELRREGFRQTQFGWTDEPMGNTD